MIFEIEISEQADADLRNIYESEFVGGNNNNIGIKVAIEINLEKYYH